MAAVEAGNKGLFVKVNMDGVPIGRKLDLGAHAGYDTLSAAVDHLFRGLLAGTSVRPSVRITTPPCQPVSQLTISALPPAQASGSGGEQQPIAGILNGGGGGREYTLVYEDDEGDQMLVGDVPWP